MNKYMKTGFLLLLIVIHACSNSDSAHADDDNMKTEVGQKGIMFNKLSVKAWKGVGNGGVTFGNKENTSEQIFYAESKESDSQTVIVAESLKVKLHAGHYYALSTEVNSQGVVTYFDFIAALRTGKNRDIFEKYSNIDSWTTVTLLLDPVEDVIPFYFAIRLFGQGKVFAKPLSLTELTKEEFDQKRKILVAEKTALAQKRIEKVFLPYTPSLPLPTNESPEQFKIWGTAEESYPPPPFGWRQVPGDRPDIENAVTDRLKSAEYLIYTRPTAMPVYLESVPKTNELVSSLTAQATPGEYKPVNFAIYSAKNLEGVRIRVTDLKSDKNQVIKNTNIDIRTVNFTRKIKDNTQKTYYQMPLTLGKR
ncbi:MAG: hypothetical protein KJ630_24450, partial [Proteobacteria bacterium]|nr:hypothetical protein [Pseudomonadota bacterium]